MKGGIVLPGGGGGKHAYDRCAAERIDPEFYEEYLPVFVTARKEDHSRSEKEP